MKLLSDEIESLRRDFEAEVYARDIHLNYDKFDDLFEQAKLANTQRSIIERADHYLWHETDCHYYKNSELSPCTCGLQSILSDINKLKGCK